MRMAMAVLGGMIATLMLLAGTAQAEEGEPGFSVAPLGGGAYMLQGRGGNVGVVVGADAVLVIDDDYENMSAALLETIGRLSDAPIEFVLNTHYHGDHTGGNAALDGAGALVYAHDNVRARLASEDLEVLPELTFNDRATVHVDGTEVHAIHVHNAHTDGDAFVHIPSLDVIHTGDLMFNGRYPYIDLGAGGSVDGVVAALKQILALAGAETQIIPGHGPLATSEDVERTIALIEDAAGKVRSLVAEGKSLQEVQSIDPLAEYHERYAWAFITAERFTEHLYADAVASAQQ